MTKEQIRELRRALDLTQAEFARALGSSSASTVSQWENGLRKPDRYFSGKLNELFELKARGILLNN